MTKLEFEQVLAPLIEIIDNIELDMIHDLLSRIDNYNSHKGTLKWYTDKLAELKLLDKNNLKNFRKSKTALKKAIKDIAKECGGKIDNFSKLQDYYNQGKININPLTLYDSVAVNNLINNAIKETNDIMDLIQTKALEGAKEGYKQILNKAYVETASGVYTYTEAIKRATNELAEKGIQAAHYSDGRSISIEAVVRRDVVTRMNKLVGDISIQRAKEMETNLVYVDQHLGARIRNKYMKHDYEAHAEWQGKKYMLEGSSNKYPNFYEATGYGEMLGLKGINCYHDFSPTWEWEKIKDLIDPKKNEEEYKKLQSKRTQERNLRKIRRKIAEAEAMGDEAKLKKLKEIDKEQTEDYEKWLKENNMRRDYSREYVSTNYKDNTKILGVNHNSNNFKTDRKYIETINLLDVDKKLNEYENSIYKNEFESAFVIQQNGDVIKFIGDDTSIKLYEVDLQNAIITHNHPPDDGIYRSFGHDDFNVLKNNNINRMRAVTLDYEYEVKKLKELDISYNEVYKEAMQHLFIDENLEIQHEVMEILKKKGYVDYERRTRKN